MHYRTNIYLRLEQKEKLKRASNQTGILFSELIRRAIDSSLLSLVVDAPSKAKRVEKKPNILTKILPLVDIIPESQPPRVSKYEEIWEKCKLIPCNQFMPVEFEDIRKAELFAMAATQMKNRELRHLIIHRRKNIVYLGQASL